VACGSDCCSVYGDSTSLGGSGNYGAGDLCVRPVTIGKGGTLVDIGILSYTPGVEVVLGLYSDSAGAPDELIAQTAVAVVPDGALVVPTPPTAVSAGSYWIATWFDASATVDESATETVTAYCTSEAFTSTLPATFPSSYPYTGREANWYLLVE
jgi:hypothetical protein